MKIPKSFQNDWVEQGRGHTRRSHLAPTPQRINECLATKKSLHTAALNNIFIEFVSFLNIFTYNFFVFFFKFRKNTNTEHLISKMNVAPSDLMVARVSPGFLSNQKQETMTSASYQGQETVAGQM